MQTRLTCLFSVLVVIISAATGCASPTTGAGGGQRPFVDAEAADQYLLEARLRLLRGISSDGAQSGPRSRQIPSTGGFTTTWCSGGGRIRGLL